MVLGLHDLRGLAHVSGVGCATHRSCLNISQVQELVCNMVFSPRIALGFPQFHISLVVQSTPNEKHVWHICRLEIREFFLSLFGIVSYTLLFVVAILCTKRGAEEVVSARPTPVRTLSKVKVAYLGSR